jgi:cytochrome oxidase Cu insertion factor (SCO1/SenC/PrrC family)
MAKRIAIAILLLGAMVFMLNVYLPGAPSPELQGNAPSAALFGGTFALTDAKGNAVTDAALKGHYSLVFFGFTHCPDVCPLTLQKLTQAIELAPGVDVQPVFISVDPERDTPEAMASYAASFHPRLLALTGTPEQVQAAAKVYRVFYEKEPLKDASGNLTGDYTMNHSGSVFLMDKEGRFLDRFDSNATSAAIAVRLQALGG